MSIPLWELSLTISVSCWIIETSITKSYQIIYVIFRVSHIFENYKCFWFYWGFFKIYFVGCHYFLFRFSTNFSIHHYEWVYSCEFSGFIWTSIFWDLFQYLLQNYKILVFYQFYLYVSIILSIKRSFVKHLEKLKVIFHDHYFMNAFHADLFLSGNLK